MSWNCYDPDQSDSITYDIYFGQDNPPQKVMSNQSSTFYDPGELDGETVYYWRIVAWDNHGASSSGPIWDFTTEKSDGSFTSESNENVNTESSSQDQNLGSNSQNINKRSVIINERN